MAKKATHVCPFYQLHWKVNIMLKNSFCPWLKHFPAKTLAPTEQLLIKKSMNEDGKIMAHRNKMWLVKWTHLKTEVVGYDVC